MAGSTLSEKFLSTSRGRIVAALRHGPQSVDELATALGLSPNAIRSHLATLERDSLVHVSGTRRGAGAGKPANLYAVDPAAEAAFSRAYAPLLLALLDELDHRQSDALTADALRRVGRRMAHRLGLPAPANRAEGIARSVAVLTALGGEVRHERHRGQDSIAGCGACPLGEAVTEHPGVCRAVEALLADVSGERIKSACEHGNRPRCRFEVAPST
jgi:predicted ArsR family transcriptional regulator